MKFRFCRGILDISGQALLIWSSGINDTRPSFSRFRLQTNQPLLEAFVQNKNDARYF